ncbi:MAG: membrane protein insertase YidC, partial [Flavobacteriaceae bacterium]|nr:membrane protein insertase YidC [Flavobacteriaceae bacterium]
MDSQDNKNAILAVILSGLILFGWQYFYGPQTQPYDTSQNSTQNPSAKSTRDINKPNSTVVSKPITKLSTINLSNESYVYTVDSKLNIIDIQNTEKSLSLSKVFKIHTNSIKFNSGGVELGNSFSFTKVNDSLYSISNSDSSLRGNLKLLKNGVLNINITSDKQFVPIFNITSKSDKLEDETKINNFSFLVDGLEQVAVYDKVEGEDDETEKFEHNLHWFGLDFNYHLFAFVYDLPSKSKLETRNNILLTSPLEHSNSLNYNIVFLRKNYDQLKSLGHNLHQSVDFGMWSIVAVPLLRGLQLFYSWFNNYGISIIILTILIRLLTFPLQYKSFKSMKKMQIIQPELKAIKEKFKDNPQKQQQETMALFKKAGANPLSGCLPMLLQMPIFFAFYQVLFTSVELVDAPFYFWIQDLSEKDPYYILPVL